jgi:putative FmdB family regulatory protein
MPIYEYRCESCGHQLDALQKMADAHLTDCPACEQPTLRRMVSAPSFRLKGSGWYETDFKKDQDKKRNLADGGGGAANTGAGDAGAGAAGAGADKAVKADAGSSDSAKSASSGGESKSADAKSGGKDSGKGGAGKGSSEAVA